MRRGGAGDLTGQAIIMLLQGAAIALSTTGQNIEWAILAIE